MVTAEMVKKLNKRIEDLNAKSTRAKAKIEVLESTLEKSLEDYEAVYGVSLRGKSMAETIKNIQSELNAVNRDTEKEFDLRNKVVDAIERGDIEYANALLGVAPLENPFDVPDDSETGEAGDYDGMPSDVVDSHSETSSEDDEVLSGGLSGGEYPSSSVGGFAVPTDSDDEYGFSIMNDEDDEGFIVQDEDCFSIPDDGVDGFSIMGGEDVHHSHRSEKSSAMVDLISDDEADDFGLGGLLSGSRFSIDD